MPNSCQIFIYTIEEYKRFAKCLPVQETEDISVGYTEMDYVGVQVRLMLLRKYFSKNGNVSFKNVIKKAIELIPEKTDELQKLSTKFDEIEKQQFEHILANGTRMNIYETIEANIYGLYLHADEKKLLNLNKQGKVFGFIAQRNTF